MFVVWITEVFGELEIRRMVGGTFNGWHYADTFARMVGGEVESTGGE